MGNILHEMGSISGYLAKPTGSGPWPGPDCHPGMVGP